MKVSLPKLVSTNIFILGPKYNSKKVIIKKRNDLAISDNIMNKGKLSANTPLAIVINL